MYELFGNQGTIAPFGFSGTRWEIAELLAKEMLDRYDVIRHRASRGKFLDLDIAVDKWALETVEVLI